MDIEAFVLAMGIPSAIFGLFVWYIKRDIDKKDRIQQEREQRREEFQCMQLSCIRANTDLCRATAVAVQRIPDAKCNGDMTEALKKQQEARDKENAFLTQHGIYHIFEQ